MKKPKQNDLWSLYDEAIPLHDLIATKDIVWVGVECMLWTAAFSDV